LTPETDPRRSKASNLGWPATSESYNLGQGLTVDMYQTKIPKSGRDLADNFDADGSTKTKKGRGFTELKQRRQHETAIPSDRPI
jgi:hypothetical protein